MKDSSRSTLSEVGQACRRPRATSSTNLVRFRLMDGSLLESEVRHSSRKERPRSARSLSARWGTARARPRRSSTQLSEATEKKTQTERTCDENKRLEMSRRLSPKRTEPLSGYPQRGTRTHERREAKASVLLISAPHRPRKPRGRGPKKNGERNAILHCSMIAGVFLPTYEQRKWSSGSGHIGRHRSWWWGRSAN